MTEEIQIGQHSSWIVVNDSMVIKHMDKTTLDYSNSTIPIPVQFFFNIENNGKSKLIKNITFQYFSEIFNGVIRYYGHDTKIYWEQNLKKLIEYDYPSEKCQLSDEFPYMIFRKKAEDYYLIDIIQELPPPDILKNYSLSEEPIFNEEAYIDISTIEDGEKKYTYASYYERNPKNRKAAIEIHGCKCQACGFDFVKTYGELGRGYIQVHHVDPLHITGKHSIDPRTDLVCLCANCHAMIHRNGKKPIPFEDFKKLVRQQHI